MNRTLLAAAASLALLTACRQQPVIERVPDSSVSFPAPTVTSTPSLRAEGPSPSCVHGWREPRFGSPDYALPLAELKRMQKLDKDFHAVDLRRFIGPEAGTERWYGQVVYTGKPDFLIRFIAARPPSSPLRIVAIADYATTGFESPDWYGLGDGGSTSTYPGLPGTWPGKPYDYVRSGKLPAEVRGCVR